MKQTFVFAQSMGEVTCKLPSGEEVILPVVPGILKHPRADMLPGMIARPEVARKYTLAVLRNAAWTVLRLFPREWLRQCLPAADLPPGRAGALMFLLNNE